MLLLLLAVLLKKQKIFFTITFVYLIEELNWGYILSPDVVIFIAKKDIVIQFINKFVKVSSYICRK